MFHTNQFLSIGKSTINSVSIPNSLKNAIFKLLKSYPRSTLASDCKRLSSFYKREISNISDSNNSVIVEYGQRESIAFTAAMMPYSYGILYKLLKEIKRLNASASFKEILDYGCGPGAAAWAALEIASEEKVQTATSLSLTPPPFNYTGIDISEDMLNIGEELLKSNNVFDMKSPLLYFNWSRYFNFMPKKKRLFDLVIGSNVLSDILDPDLRKQTLFNLYESSSDLLLLVDSGSPIGFNAISNARKQLIQKYNDSGNAGFHILGPCRHEGRCPMETLPRNQYWCHFKQRVELTSLQREIYGYKVGYMDTNYSYLIVKKGKRAEQQVEAVGRIIREPRKLGRQVLLDLCKSDENTLERFTVPKSQGKDIYYDARKASWGDLWPHPPKSKPQVLPPVGSIADKMKRITMASVAEDLEVPINNTATTISKYEKNEFD